MLGNIIATRRQQTVTNDTVSKFLLDILSSSLLATADSSGVDIEPIAQEGADGHDHDHGHGHGEGPETTGPCACKAEDFGFAMDCSDTAAMVEALNVLKTGGCSTDCSTPACEKNWYIVQAHHDYCDTSAIPNEIEVSKCRDHYGTSVHVHDIYWAFELSSTSNPSIPTCILSLSII